VAGDLRRRFTRLRSPATIGALVDGLRVTHEKDDVILQRGMDLFQPLHKSMTTVPAVGQNERLGRVRARRTKRTGKKR
jgi:hypothetical protein